MSAKASRTVRTRRYECCESGDWMIEPRRWPTPARWCSWGQRIVRLQLQSLTIGADPAWMYDTGTDANASSISAAIVHRWCTFASSEPATTLRSVCSVMMILVANVRNGSWAFVRPTHW
jgi:hypothetical protein